MIDSQRVAPTPSKSQRKSQSRSQSSKQLPVEKQASNKGKKQKTVAPVVGQSSLDVFIKRANKKEEKSNKAKELTTAIGQTDLKNPTIKDFKKYTEWFAKEGKAVEPNPENMTPEEPAQRAGSAQKSAKKVSSQAQPVQASQGANETPRKKSARKTK